MSLWEERDKAIAAGEEKLNNQNIEKYSADKDADYGCKGNKDFWYGYKRHVAVCMRNGLITKTAVTKASITDAKGLKHVCPKEGMVIADKAYCVKPAQDIMRKNGCHSGAILKENMIGKNRDKDRCLVPNNCGIMFKDTKEERELLWDKYYMQMPEQRRQSVERSVIVKRA